MIEASGLSDIGRKRKNNQDCLLLNREQELFLLADGMGGHAAGSVAAELTVNTVSDFVTLAGGSRDMTWPFGYRIQIPFEYNVLRTGVMLANLKVLQVAEQMEKYAGMGSTVVAVWIREGRAYFSHLGDSRLYLMRDGDLTRLTEDHSLVQEQVRRGVITAEEARTHHLRHIVTHAIGSRDRYEVEVQDRELRQGDLLMLCCDGLTDKVEESDLRALLQGESDLEAACRLLVDSANAAGGDDNISVLLVRVG